MDDVGQDHHVKLPPFNFWTLANVVSGGGGVFQRLKRQGEREREREREYEGGYHER